MSFWTLVIRSLFYHSKIQIAVALGVAAATAVLTGALLVGESMRHSLREVAMERLGGVDEVLITDHYFREELATELSEQLTLNTAQKPDCQVEPAIIYQASTLEHRGESDSPLSATDVFLIASGDGFWAFDDRGVKPKVMPQGKEIVINEQLAIDLGVDPAKVLAFAEARAAGKTGDELPPAEVVTLRIPKPQNIQGDNALGRKDDVVISLIGLTVVDVVPNRGLARFGLHVTQAMTHNAFVPLELIQEPIRDAIQPRQRRRRQTTNEPPRLEKPINALLIGDGQPGPLPAATSELIHAALHPSMMDYGLILREIELTYQETEEADVTRDAKYMSLSSQEMLLDEPTQQIALSAYGEYDPTIIFTYLANELQLIKDGKPIDKPPVPFSMVTAVDFGNEFVPQSAVSSEPATPLETGQVAINEWLKNDLGAEVGDTLRIGYYDPETTHGTPTLRAQDLEIVDVLAFTKRGYDERTREALPFTEPPTLVNDPDLTPYVSGFTDAESISDEGVLPFETQSKMRPPNEDGVLPDDDYWYRYRTTPKAFISYDDGVKFWGSRFGDATSLRFTVEEPIDREKIEDKFLTAQREAGDPLGFAFDPIKSRWLKSSSGTTPFDGLFLALSFFIIFSAVILIALLFRLAVESRSREIGVLMATGFTSRHASKVLLAEAVLVSTVGSLIGVVIGILYGWAMIYGLTTIWVGAIGSPFLEFKLGWMSLAIGFISGIVVSCLTIIVTLYFSQGRTVREFLGGQTSSQRVLTKPRIRVLQIVVAIALFAAVALAAYATQLGGQLQGMVFVGAGSLLLSAFLLATWDRFRFRAWGRDEKSRKLTSLRALSTSNVGRFAGRSTLTIGLVAVASFLIVAISAFHLQPTEEGTGGFDLIVQTNRPVFENMNDMSVRVDQFGQDAATKLGDARIMSFRVKSGDYAGCTNPYQTTQPQILGVTRETARYFDQEGVQGFAWAGATAVNGKTPNNPWHLLFADSEDDLIPVVIDKNTAMYSLKVYAVGSEFEMTYDEEKTLRFRVVGFLDNTVLQGRLLISEERLKDHFPDVSGYQYFLVDVSPSATGELKEKKQEVVVDTLRSQLGDLGFSAVTTEATLADLLAVQNTYLSTFQILGGLGLLFGTFGLATIQLRNVLDRQRELALMRAAGYTRQRLAQLVLAENANVLLRGLSIGVASALFAIIPHIIFGNASVPWLLLVIMIGVIAIVGVATSGLVIRVLYRSNILDSLRRE